MNKFIGDFLKNITYKFVFKDKSETIFTVDLDRNKKQETYLNSESSNDWTQLGFKK